MTPFFKHVFDNMHIFADFEPRLQTVYAEMDRQYRQTADRYHFHCNGCDDNCCKTQFYHHTLLEFLYVEKGLQALDPDTRFHVVQRSDSVHHRHMAAAERGIRVREMCPLNIYNLCVLYDYRPMICRLHGIPYALRQPGRPVFYGPGCHLFEQQCADKPYMTFDRTSLYSAMAELENHLRSAYNFKQKIKFSIAEMILTMQSGYTR